MVTTLAEQFAILLDSFVQYVDNHIEHDTIKSHIRSWQGRPIEDTVLLINKFLSEWRGNMQVYVATLYATFGVQPPLEVTSKLIEYLNTLEALAAAITKE